MSTSKTLSNAGLDIIRKFEGCRLTAYKVQSTDKYYTIGYGHYGSDVKQGMKITESQAIAFLKTDTLKSVKHVNTYMKKYNFNQNQFDALVSFTYNVGSIKQLTENGTRTIALISEKIPLYCNSNGVKLSGLVKRRKEEQALFNTPCDDKSIQEIATECINGLWGNGAERKEKLTKAGYDYSAVQKQINMLLSK